MCHICASNLHCTDKRFTYSKHLYVKSFKTHVGQRERELHMICATVITAVGTTNHPKNNTRLKSDKPEEKYITWCLKSGDGGGQICGFVLVTFELPAYVRLVAGFRRVDTSRENTLLLSKFYSPRIPFF